MLTLLRLHDAYGERMVLLRVFASQLYLVRWKLWLIIMVMTFENIQEFIAKDEHRCLELKKTTGELQNGCTPPVRF